MQQQKPLSRPIPPAIRKYLPDPARDRIWFPMTTAELDNSSVIDFGTAIFGARAQMVMPRAIYAVRTVDESAIRECLPHLRPASPHWNKWSAKLERFPAIGGYIIPVSSIDETWFLTKTGSDQLLDLAVRLSRLILHIDSANIDFGSDSPSQALKTRKGRCFDKASLLTAIFRLNGIPTRVIGRTDLYDDGTDGGHWLVEAYIEDKWQKYDSVYAPNVVEWVFDQARHMGVSPVEFPHFLAQALAKLVAEGVAVNQITSQDCLHKIDGMIVAAEIDLPGQV